MLLKSIRVDDTNSRNNKKLQNYYIFSKMSSTLNSLEISFFDKIIFQEWMVIESSSSNDGRNGGEIKS